MKNLKTRSRQTLGTGFAVYGLYLLVFIGVWMINGVDYTRIGESEDTLWRWYVAPLAAGSIVVILATTWLGWWKPVIIEKMPAPRWALLAPALMGLGAIVGIATNDYHGITSGAILLAVAGSLLVGFNEEVVTRGILLTAARSRFREPVAWLISTLFFSLLHLPNAFLGLGAGVLFQLVFTFGFGTVFYLLRRASGSLIPAMLLHAAWDLGGFLGEDVSGARGLAGPAAGLIAVISVLVLHRGEHSPITSA